MSTQSWTQGDLVRRDPAHRDTDGQVVVFVRRQCDEASEVLAPALLIGVEGHDVLVPSPSDALLERDRALEVVIAQPPVSSRRPAERIPVISVLKFVTDSGATSALMLEMSMRSTYPSVPQPFINLPSFLQVLRSNGNDLWASLLQVGAVNEGMLITPSPELLRSISRQRLPVWQDISSEHLDTTPEAIFGHWWCKIIRCR